MDTKGIFIKYFLIFFVFGSILILLSGISQAATHYVSPSGTATWEDSTNIATSCSIATAMANASAGDIVYFRGGTYAGGESAAYHAYFEPDNSGTESDPITFIAYPGETPIVSLTLPNKVIDYAIGNGFRDYIIWDGFITRATDNDSAGPYMAGADNNNRAVGCIIRNCTAIAGTNEYPTGDNADLCRADWTSHCTWERNKIGNLHTASYSDNNAALKLYHNDHMTIQNCEFYDSPNGISAKSDLDDSIIRYNYFHGNAKHIRVNTYLATSSDSNQIYHNVFWGATNGSLHISCDSGTEHHANDWEFYNNTAYGSGLVFGRAGSGTGIILYNNIIHGCTDQLTTARECYIAESDHNQFGTSTFDIILEVYHDERTYTSLANWQSSGELEGGGNPGQGSLASDPRFVNSSGSMNQLDDFRLASDSPCKDAGRGGVDMGADISLVGLRGGGPNPPQNLKIVPSE